MAENIEGENGLQGMTPAEIIEAAENLVKQKEIKNVILLVVKECDEVSEDGEAMDEVVAISTIQDSEEILDTLYTAADMFEEALEDSDNGDNTGEEGGELSEA